MANQRWRQDSRRGPFIVTDPNDGSARPLNETPDAKVLNIGTTSYPNLASTSGNFVNVRGEATHTSGDVRNIYNRLYLKGADGNGESLRTFTTVSGVGVVSAHGAHISLNFTADAASTSDLGVASRCTLHIPDVASWSPGGGTMAPIQAEIYSDGAASDPGGLTELSFIRCVSDGNAAGKADVDDDAFLLSLQGVTPEDGDTGTGSLVTTGCADIGAAGNLTAALKIKIGSTTYWIPAATAIAGDGA